MAKIGIDFGTTNSLIVAYDKRNKTFSYFNFAPNIINQPIPTSSTVWYYDNKIIVGTEARENINTYGGIAGHHFEKSIKLKLGQDYGVNIFGINVSPHSVAAEILKHMKADAIEKWKAKDNGINLDTAVFTVPINFNGKQRRALREAARESGIEVITFIHEPFAAIVGYIFTKETDDKNYDPIIELNKLNGKCLLIFDWGGGTLDITVVKIEDNKMLEIGTAELTGKAGDKFDENIAYLVWARFINKQGIKINESALEKIRKDNWDKILARAEKCKIRLSDEDSVDFILPIGHNLEIKEKVTRNDFKNLIKDILIEASNEIDNAIREANIGKINIDQVILTGGTCYIPVVQEYLNDKFGSKVVNVNNADLLIAQGAAVIAEMGWLPFLTKDISIQLSDDSLYPIFEKNTNIAVGVEAKKTEDLVCCDNRGGEARIIIVEGEEQRNDKTLAILKVPVLNHSQHNDDIKLDAIIDQDIILKISARSLMVRGFKQPEEAFSEIKKTEVHKLCFGLKFYGRK